MSAPSPAADLNLLFAVLAMQNELVAKDDLLAAMNAWGLEKHRPLGDILVERGALVPVDRQLLDGLIERQLKRHGSPEKSLAAAPVSSWLKDQIRSLCHPDMEASVASLGVATDPFATKSYTASEAGIRYRILRPHARGGLGDVFVAEDAELHRQVALKQIQAQHAGSEASRGRFVLEAEITGGLEHPGIVPVYGLGTYGDGRPFYAMRFITGDNLKEAIARFHSNPSRGRQEAGATAPPTVDRGSDFASLAFRQLLGRFIDVCDAVAYAHSRGVLHRDLKPGNIMLGKFGETLVVDWGLAKVIGRASAESGDSAAEATLRISSGSGVAETVAGSAIGTPAYMSPEQAAGRLDLLGPASDVYSLGATLYCLLTGQAPVNGEPAEVLKKVQAGDITRPRLVAAEVAPALEAICVKAMALRPQERYASPRVLAEDVERWLADEPVRAWPEPWLVRSGRWVRRHKPLVSGMAAALLVTLVTLTAGGFWYQQEQNRQAAEAAQRQAEAERKRLLLEAAIGNALEQAEQARQELQAELRKPGGVFVLLNEPDGWKHRLEAARSLLERARALLVTADEGLDAPLAERAAHLAQQLRQDDRDRKLAVALEQIRMDVAATVENDFDFAGAARKYPPAFAGAGLAVLTEEPAAVAARLRAAPIQEALVAALDHWAFVAFRLKEDKLLGVLLEMARLAAPDPAWGDRLRQPAVWRDQEALTALVREAPVAGLSPPLLELIGSLLKDGHPLQEAWFRQAQAQYPADFWLNFDLGTTLGKKAKLAEAVGFIRVALAMRPRSSAAYYSLAHALYLQKQPAAAIAFYQKAIEIDPKLAYAYNGLGNALCAEKQLTAAITAFEKAIDLDPKLAHVYYNLGLALYAHKQPAAAIAAYKKAIEVDPKFAQAYNELGLALYAHKQPAAAIDFYQKAIEIDPKDAVAYSNLGLALYDLKQLTAAIAAYQKAIEIDPKPAQTHGAIGRALLKKGSFAEATHATQQSLDLLPAAHRLRGGMVRQLTQCQRLLALEKRLALVLNDKQAASAVELLQLAALCLHYKERHPTAVQLYQDAFQAQPTFAEEATRPHRYNAACAAALAGSGKGDEAAKLPEEARARLRQQARAWLKADLDLYARQLPEAKPTLVLHIEELLVHCLTDADLAGIRDAKELARLAPAEARSWQAWWTEVAAMLKEVRSRRSETRLEGTLTDKHRSHVHERTLLAGKTYVIDLESSEFDTLLKLESPDGKPLAENDDIELGVNENSRLIFTAPQDGVYRLIATSFEQAGTGPYMLRIREFSGGK
jgi:serine/threonine protein kinase/Tfp pilus assembly protein PilF